MKYDVTRRLYMCENSANMDLSKPKQPQKDDLNLEELIKCVSIGKSAIDPVRFLFVFGCQVLQNKQV